MRVKRIFATLRERLNTYHLPLITVMVLAGVVWLSGCATKEKTVKQGARVQGAEVSRVQEKKVEAEMKEGSDVSNIHLTSEEDLILLVLRQLMLT